MNKTTLIAAAVVAVLAAAGALYWTSTTSETETVAEVETQDDVDLLEITEMTLGEEDAPVEVVEYASFTCSHCGNFHNDSFKQLKSEYIDTGKVHFTYREVYFDGAALWASQLARCGGEERFFGLTDLIYSGQREWIGEGDPVQMADGLRKIGRIAGLDKEAIDACLEDEQMAKSLAAWFQQNREADAINSTPTFIVNDTRVEGNNPGRLREVIEAELAE